MRYYGTEAYCEVLRDRGLLCGIVIRDRGKVSILVRCPYFMARKNCSPICMYST